MLTLYSGTLDDAALARERAMVFAAATDMLTLAALVCGAIWANSLMMMGESLRGGLIQVLEVILLILMRRVHRGELHYYDYGTAKLEQAGTLAVGSAMGLAGIWVGASAAQRWWYPPQQAELGLIFCAVAGAANAVQNGVVLAALWRAGRDGTSIIMRSQIRVRLARFVSSAVVVVALVVNALAGSGPVAVAAEVLGSIFVALVMLELAFSLWRKALPSLLDRTLDEAQQASINRVLAEHFDQYDALLSVRSRLLGNTAVVDIALGFAPERRLEEVQPVLDEVRSSVLALIPGAQVGVIPVSRSDVSCVVPVSDGAGQF
jgi:divalent metal cation (Fe/Co/Zn/Cd) transporter